MHRGYTKRWRKRWDKNYHLDAYLWLLMDYFIDFANYKDSEIYFPNVGLIPLKRGQHLFGTRELARKLRIGRQMLRTRLILLENMQFLTLEPTHNYTIATVINYDIYNPCEDMDNPQINHQPTRVQPTTNPRLTTPNKDKKEKKVKKIIDRFIPPTENDVIKYFQENGYTSSSAIFAFKYYSEAHWHDSRGNKVKNWKQKMRGVWFKPENEMQQNKIIVPKETPTPDYLKDFIATIGKEVE